MSNLISILTVILGVQAFAMTANAKTFTGFKRKLASIVSTLSGPVAHFRRRHS